MHFSNESLNEWLVEDNSQNTAYFKKMQTVSARDSIFMIIVTITHNFYTVRIYLISIILKDYNYMKNREIKNEPTIFSSSSSLIYYSIFV